ncbi:MAG TPA: DUF1800 domain-containing protein [Gemmatimonadaceae bacterium]|nr:DUF1800 domain-containing protein [Gemmatimonadaceae bacterium]
MAESAESAGESVDRPDGRRAALQAGVLALAGLLAPVVAGAQGARRKAPGDNVPRPGLPPATISPELIDAASGWLSPELRLVRRITMGLSASEATLAQQLGYSAYLERHLNAASIDDSAVNQFVATNYPTTVASLDTLSTKDSGLVQSELTNAMVYRAAFSARQLQERLVEFWTDHFNISFEKVKYLKAVDDRDVIRRYAMTSFPQLLKASAHSVAMLAYLDQTSSTSDAPNQNYAREIMELHTLGVKGGYTQTDVAELSRVLTGWTTEGKGTFVFSPSLHDYDAKTVLGVNIPAASPSTGAAAVAEGERMLDVLAAHPSTALFISTKMLKFFLRYDPSEAQIAAVASAYRSSQGNIKSMLRVVLSRQNLVAAPAKLKRPYHLVVSAVRALGAQVADPGPLSDQIANAGHQPFTWQTPDGFPDKIEYWSGDILPRWNYAAFLASADAADSVRFDVARFMTAGTAPAVVSSIDRFCFGGEMPMHLREELAAYVAPDPTDPSRVREAVSLALSAYTFQFY